MIHSQLVHKAEQFALGHYLSEYDKDYSFEDTLNDLVYINYDIVSIRAEFTELERRSTELERRDLAKKIEAMKSALIKAFTETKVVVHVSHGVAELVECPEGVQVEIIDFDSEI